MELVAALTLFGKERNDLEGSDVLGKKSVLGTVDSFEGGVSS